MRTSALGAGALAALLAVSSAHAGAGAAGQEGGVTFLSGGAGGPAVDIEGARPMPLPSAPPPDGSDLSPRLPLSEAGPTPGNSSPGSTGSGALDLKGRP